MAIPLDLGPNPRLLFDFRPRFQPHRFRLIRRENPILHSVSAITKFQISLRYHDSLKSRIDYWLRFAVSRRVEHLYLVFLGLDYKAKYPLPCFIYIHPNLTKLNISDCIINPPEIVHLPSLKDLCLVFTQLSDAVVAKLLSGSPSLESLDLCFCSGFRDLKIRSAILKQLTFHRLALGLVKEILAPNLESLNIIGDFRLSEYKPIAAPSVVEVELHFSWGHFLHGNNPPEDDHEIRRKFKELLQNFPKHQKLTLYSDSNYSHKNDVVRSDILDSGKDFWRSEGKISTFSCLQHNLKRVEIIGFAPNKAGWEFADPLVEFCLTMHLCLRRYLSVCRVIVVVSC